jgi:hypothetical protein
MVINCPLPNWTIKVSAKETYVSMVKGKYNHKNNFSSGNVCNSSSYAAVMTRIKYYEEIKIKACL